MARQLRADQTRAAILTAAADLFDRHGYESTSLSDIVEHAQVAKGALYFHFAAKGDLAQAIMEFQSRAFRQVASEAAARGSSSLEALIRTTFGITRLAVEGPILRAGLRLAMGGVVIRPPLLHPFSELLLIVVQRLRGAVKEADIHPDVDVNAVAYSLVSSFIGTSVVGRVLEPVGRHPRRVGEMWQLMIRGLVPVTRRARYLSLTARLERETREVTIGSAPPVGNAQAETGAPPPSTLPPLSIPPTSLAGDHIDFRGSSFYGPVVGKQVDYPEQRRLKAELAEQASPGREVPLHVQVTCDGGQGGVALRAFELPAEGARLLITVHAPGLFALGDLQQELWVEAGVDSDVLRFGLRTDRPGLHAVTVRAYRGGSFLGELRLQISVQADVPARDGAPRVAPLDSLAFDPGEVTLQVLKAADGYNFQLISETSYAPAFQLKAGDHRQATENIYRELRRIAAAAGVGTVPPLVA